MLAPKNTVRIENVSAPMPFMVPAAASRFNRLRKIVLGGSGVDFLSKCADIMRPSDFVSNKDGVAKRSWHLTGRCFDYDQTSPVLIIVSDPIGGKQYFRTFLLCADQSGKHGVKRHLRDYRGGSTNAYVFDFTGAAEAQGFKRIPAWRGWQNQYNRREFWHYQFDEGLTWAQAMAAIATAKTPPPDVSVKTPSPDLVIGLNDRDKNTGGRVTQIQMALFKIGLLPMDEVDGVFGAKTRNAVQAFQRSKGLDADGLVGPETRAALGI